MQVQGVMAGITMLLICTLTMTSAAKDCDISAPHISLSELHRGCNSNRKSRHPDCVWAMNRFCSKISGFPFYSTTLGVSREHRNGVIDMSCIRSLWSGNVEISALQRYHGPCSKSKSQHRDCLAAIHRWCTATIADIYEGKYTAGGMSQGVPQSNSLDIACFKTPRKERVRWSVLAKLHSPCNIRGSPSDSDNCFAAASRWCVQRGHSGGITQEVNNRGVMIACYDAEFSNSEFIARDSNYYDAQTVTKQICVDFDIGSGTVSSLQPLIIKEETYDNRDSTVALEQTFEVSHEVVETNSFTHSESLTIGAEASFSANLPFDAGSASLTISTSVTTGLSLTKENTKTVKFVQTSPVNVPPGKAVIRRAMLQKENIAVPYTGKIIDGLGGSFTTRGTWNSISYNLKVEQEDL